MEIDDIKRLVELMEEQGVVELEMEDHKGKIRLVRENHHAPAPVPASVLAAASPQPMPALAVTVPHAPEGQAVESAPTAAIAISSPMVGTFYRSPSPDAKPYVDIGTVVEKGDVVCIIEAMKMMNEIQAEMRGRVVKIPVENGKPVEYGQPLFLLEPL